MSLFFAVPVFAQTTTAPKAPVTPTFLVGEKVILDGEYPGSVFVTAGEVELTGTVHGDLIILGGSVRVRGTVGQDLYVLSGTTFVENTVGGNITAAGSEIRLAPSSSVSGSLISASKRLTTGGTVNGSVYSRAQETQLGGFVAGSVELGSQSISEQSDLIIQGNKKVEVYEVEPKREQTMGEKVVEHVNRFLFEVLWRSVILVFAWYFGKEGIKKGAKLLKVHPVKVFFDGVTVLVLSLLAGILFLITLFGFPLFFLAVTSLLVASMSGWIFVVPLIGEKILKDQPEWLVSTAGLIVLSLLISLPVIGWLAQILFVGWSVGVWWNVLRSNKTAKA